MADSKIAFKIKKVAKKLFEIRFFRYCLVGGIAAITDLTVFFTLNELLKLHYLVSLAISFTVAAGVNYALQRKVTFKSTYSKKHKQFAMFLGIMLIGFILNAAITIVQVELFGVWPTLAKFMAIIIGTIYSYYANSNITFKVMK